MIWPPEPLKIVRSYPGVGTMDTIHEDQNGGLWKTEHAPFFTDAGTLSSERRIVRHGHLWPERYKAGRG